ncbi:MAG TPA: hypothetical protein VH040_11720 [Usitatibacter sp.]|jgi:hypothetical protein|nr:hypothetical protein [Usitatibacter sp.]
MGTPYRMELAVHESFLQATVFGEHTPENAMRFLREVYEACLANRKDSVLLDMRLDGPTIGTANIFGVVQERSGEGRGLRRIAYVDAAREPEKAKFAETVARNRGVNVRLFATVEDAKKWLGK